MPNTDHENGPFYWQYVEPPPPPPPPPPPTIDMIGQIREIREKGRPFVGTTDIPLPMAEILFGFGDIPKLTYEPDARYAHERYYYNTRLNRLYVKVDTEPVPVWRPIGG